MATRVIERTDVQEVREVQATGAGADDAPASPLPPFVRQVSNRDFPQGRRPGSDG